MNKFRNWFVVQVMGGKEDKVRRLIKKQKFSKLTTLLPKRKLLIKKSGEYKWTLKPLFSGYLFINGRIKPDVYKRIVSLTGVVKIIRNSKNEPKEVPEDEIKLIFELMEDKDNEIIPQSQAILVSDTVTIVGGPLKGMRGKIITIDRRKQRAKVNLPFFNTYKTVTLSFELLNKEKE